MFVHEIMTRDVECIRPGTSLQDAAMRMRDMDVGSLPICGEDDRLAGIVTDRDITIRGVAEGKDLRKTQVSDVMSSGIVYCFDDQDVTDAAHLMEERQIRRLVVLNHDKRLVGIVSLGDLAIDTHDWQLAGEALEAVSEPVGAGH